MSSVARVGRSIHVRWLAAPAGQPARRLDNFGLNKALRCKAVIFDLQSLRVETGEETAPSKHREMFNYLASSRLTANVDPDLKAETLPAMLTYEIRDAARQRGIDSIGPREVVIERLRAHLEAQSAAVPAAPVEPAAAAARAARAAASNGLPEELGAKPAAARDKYEGKLQALRAKAAAKARGGAGSNAAEGSGADGGGWCVQPGATQLAQYLDNRGMVRALVLRPSRALLSSGPPPPSAEDVERTLGSEMRQLLDQISAPAFAAVGASASGAGLVALAAEMQVQPQSALLLSSCLELVSAARREGFSTIYFKKRLGRDTGMRGVDPDYTVTSLEEAVHAFDELNGVSFRVIPG